MQWCLALFGKRRLDWVSDVRSSRIVFAGTNCFARLLSPDPRSCIHTRPCRIREPSQLMPTLCSGVEVRSARPGACRESRTEFDGLAENHRCGHRPLLEKSRSSESDIGETSASKHLLRPRRAPTQSRRILAVSERLTNFGKLRVVDDILLILGGSPRGLTPT